MDTKPNYQLVGIFLIVSVLIICALLIWLTGGANEYTKTYSINFRKASLSGLQKDSYVTMNGITVGNVKNYKISSNDIEQVKVEIQLTDDIPIKTKTRALIARNLLTGIATVELVGGRQNDPELSAPEGQELIIPEGSSKIEQITDSIPELLKDVSEVVANLKHLASKENSESLSKSIKHLEQTTAWLSDRQSSLDRAFDSFETIGSEAGNISKDVSRIANDAGTQVNEIGKQTKEALQQITAAAATIQKQLETIGASVNGTSAVLSQEILEISKNIDVAANSIAAATEGLENPGAILTGPNKDALGPGEELNE